MLIKKRKNTVLKHLNDSKAFTESSKNMDDIHKTIKEYNPNKKCKILIVFNYIIADILGNKKLDAIVTEPFIIGTNLNISLVFITQSYFPVPKSIRLNYKRYFIMKILNNCELQQIGLNHSSDTDFRNFLDLHKKCNATPYFLVIDGSLIR